MLFTVRSCPLCLGQSYIPTTFSLENVFIYLYINCSHTHIPDKTIRRYY